MQLLQRDRVELGHVNVGRGHKDSQGFKVGPSFTFSIQNALCDPLLLAGIVRRELSAAVFQEVADALRAEQPDDCQQNVSALVIQAVLTASPERVDLSRQ